MDKIDWWPPRTIGERSCEDIEFICSNCEHWALKDSVSKTKLLPTQKISPRTSLIKWIIDKRWCGVDFACLYEFEYDIPTYWPVTAFDSKRFDYTGIAVGDASKY